jgi:hypothetical protein
MRWSESSNEFVHTIHISFLFSIHTKKGNVMDVLNYSHTSTPKAKKRYGFGSFIFDLVMTGLTGGLWLIWIFCREMRG